VSNIQLDDNIRI